MNMPRSRTILLLLVCLSLGFNLIIPFFDRRATASASLFGTTAEGNFGQLDVNRLDGSYFTAGSNGNITSITIKGGASSGNTINVSCAVYTWVANNDAGTLLGSTYETKVSSPSGAWFTLNTKANIPVVGGTKYFLVFLVGNSTGGGTPKFYFYQVTSSGAGITKTSGLTYPTFPSPLTGESATNYQYSLYATYTEDVATTPVSSADAITPYWSIAAKTITATATDGSSGDNVKNVSLWYRYSSDNASWGGYKNFGLDTASPWSWSFTFTNGSGYYQFYTIATDYDGNIESAPGSADRICGYDAVLPTSSVDAFPSYVFRTSPITVNATASDTGGSGLKEVSLWYRKSSDNATWGSYTLVSSDTAAPYSWSFATTERAYYEFYSIAQDNATNSEIGYNQDFGFNTTGTSLWSSGAWNTIYGAWYQSTYSFTLTTMRLYCAKTSGTSINVSLGIYQYVADNNAGNMLSKSNDVKITTSGYSWFSFIMNPSVSIVSGTKYFLVMYIGNSTGGGYLYWGRTAATAKGIVKSGLTYPIFPNPLTYESGISYYYSIYTPYVAKDQNIFNEYGTWDTKEAGWSRFQNTPSWQGPDGWNTFGNTSSWIEPDAGWNTFGNITSWTQTDDGWNSFMHQASFITKEQGWNSFTAPPVSWMQADAGWSTFGNAAAFSLTADGWNTFSHQASFATADSGWSSFYNGFIIVSQGWDSFGNSSSWSVLSAGWSRFTNGSVTVITAIYPDNGDVVPLNDFIFDIGVNDAHGDLMDIDWYRDVNGSWVHCGDSFTGVGNGTYYTDSAGWGLDLYDCNYTYKAVVTSSGGSVVSETIVFLTAPLGMGAISIPLLVLIILILLWVFMLVLAEWKNDPFYGIVCGVIGFVIIPAFWYSVSILEANLAFTGVWGFLQGYILIMNLAQAVNVASGRDRAKPK